MHLCGRFVVCTVPQRVSESESIQIYSESIPGAHACTCRHSILFSGLLFHVDENSAFVKENIDVARPLSPLFHPAP